MSGHRTESVPPVRRYYSCQGWGNGWDGASCFEGWEASPWEDGPSHPLKPCPACKQRIDPQHSVVAHRVVYADCDAPRRLPCECRGGPHGGYTCDYCRGIRPYVTSPGSPCKYGDPTCPCQDGGQCHYEGENPMTPPGITAPGSDQP